MLTSAMYPFERNYVREKEEEKNLLPTMRSIYACISSADSSKEDEAKQAITKLNTRDRKVYRCYHGDAEIFFKGFDFPGESLFLPHVNLATLRDLYKLFYSGVAPGVFEAELMKHDATTQGYFTTYFETKDASENSTGYQMRELIDTQDKLAESIREQELLEEQMRECQIRSKELSGRIAQLDTDETQAIQEHRRRVAGYAGGSSTAVGYGNHVANANRQVKSTVAKKVNPQNGKKKGFLKFF